LLSEITKGSLWKDTMFRINATRVHEGMSFIIQHEMAAIVYIYQAYGESRRTKIHSVYYYTTGCLIYPTHKYQKWKHTLPFFLHQLTVRRQVVWSIQLIIGSTHFPSSSNCMYSDESVSLPSIASPFPFLHQLPVHKSFSADCEISFVSGEVITNFVSAEIITKLQYFLVQKVFPIFLKSHFH